MNFLSHYFFDHNKNDHHYNFGLILPDLARNFVPGARIKPGSKDFDNRHIHSINRGCLQHLETDATFHSWDGFTGLLRVVTGELRNSGDLRPERDWFVAHIFAELMIDHQLLNSYPKLATELYTSFEQTSSHSIDSYLLGQGMDQSDRLRFHKGFDRFMDARYLALYNRPENVVYSLERICTSKRIPPFNLRQKEHFIQLISHFERIIVGTITELRTLLK